MSIADDLEKVLFGVADKWCQHSLTKGDKHCLLGWIDTVSDPRDSATERYRDSATERYLRNFILDYDRLGITSFNDVHTQQEVIWMLEEAIDDARERGL